MPLPTGPFDMENGRDASGSSSIHSSFELWLKILAFALSPFTYNGPFALITPKRPDDVKIQDLIDAQQQRARLLTLCKFLYPAIEQLLFSEVILNGEEQYEGFISRAVTKRLDNQHLGVWTRSIRILWRENNSVSFGQIINTCPNLVALQMDNENFGSYSLSRDRRALAAVEGTSYRTSLRYLIWGNYSLQWADLCEIAKLCPELTQLKLICCSEVAGEETEIATFPSLRYLTISEWCAQHFDLSNLIMPSLEHMQWEGEGFRLQPLLERRYSNILYFELFGGGCISYLYIAQLLGSCPMLSTLAFTLPDNDERAPEPPTITHPTLSHLILDVVDAMRLSNCRHYFTHEAFPNLTRITILYWGEHNREVLINLAYTVFPHATVGVEPR